MICTFIFVCISCLSMVFLYKRFFTQDIETLCLQWVAIILEFGVNIVETVPVELQHTSCLIFYATVVIMSFGATNALIP